MIKHYKITASTAQSIGDRQEQQDRLLLASHEKYSDHVMAIVADGMGGRTGGGIAAEQVITTMKQLFNSYQLNESIENLLTECVIEAHTTIKMLSISEEKEPHSTVVALICTPDTFHWMHIGDSRLYVFRQGTLKECTQDHSFVMDAISAGKMTQKEANTHPNRNMLTSALGMSTIPRFSLGYLNDPQIGDSFLLASDGLWAYFTTEELCYIVSSMTAKEATKLLMEIARERGEKRGDNISIIVIKLAAPDAIDTMNEMQKASEEYDRQRSRRFV
jgi:PPM family protein phosphatase